MVKINKKYVPIKAHFFFFFAALGPILPQLNVYGKQLGVSPAIMGTITAVLPFLWALAKPAVGFLVDYFHQCRKIIFMALIFTMSGSYLCLYLLPEPPSMSFEITENKTTLKDFNQNESDFIYIQRLPLDCQGGFDEACINHTDIIRATCNAICLTGPSSVEDNFTTPENHTFDKWHFWILNEEADGDQRLSILYYNSTDELHCKDLNMYESNERKTCIYKKGCKSISCAILDDEYNFNSTSSEPEALLSTESDYYLYGTITFWGFVIFMCAGTVGFNVANCISDAICFDVLGPENSMKYGVQRAWGTFGYGLTALISGWLVDYISEDNYRKDFTPAFIIILVFTAFDLYFCRQLELPSMTRPQDASGQLMRLMKQRSVAIFIVFAVIVGIFDSFIVYYMFWFLEEIAKETGNYGEIKLLEGIVIAVESFGGEILFFSISGKIMERLGFQLTFTISLLCYALRLFSISLITEPWHLILVEMFLQGPTYALCYAAIVGYAAAVAPPGLSATLQGIMAGMDDGVGFAIGSLLGGILYQTMGGRMSFRLFSGLAAFASVVHFILGRTVLKDAPVLKQEDKDQVQMEEMKDLMKTVPERTGDIIPDKLNGIHENA